MKRGGNRTEFNSSYRPLWPEWASNTLRKMAAQGATASQVMGVLNGKGRNFTIDAVRRRAKRMAVRLASDKRTRNSVTVRRPSSFVIPEDVFCERDYALSRPQALTAALMGDPLPGRSALDRR